MPKRETPITEAPEPPTRFEPFADEATVQTIGGLSLENGTERIAIHGAVDLTRDSAGLARARLLAQTLAAIVTALEAQKLPEQVSDAVRPAASVKNPFT